MKFYTISRNNGTYSYRNSADIQRILYERSSAENSNEFLEENSRTKFDAILFDFSTVTKNKLKIRFLLEFGVISNVIIWQITS